MELTKNHQETYSNISYGNACCTFTLKTSQGFQQHLEFLSIFTIYKIYILLIN